LVVSVKNTDLFELFFEILEELKLVVYLVDLYLLLLPDLLRHKEVLTDVSSLLDRKENKAHHMEWP
jgi:hypothetical protein